MKSLYERRQRDISKISPEFECRTKPRRETDSLTTDSDFDERQYFQATTSRHFESIEKTTFFGKKPAMLLGFVSNAVIVDTSTEIGVVA